MFKKIYFSAFLLCLIALLPATLEAATDSPVDAATAQEAAVKLSPGMQKKVDETLANLPAILERVERQVPAALERASQAIAAIQKANKKAASKLAFSIPISDYFEVGLYEKDLVKLASDFGDFLLDKFLFNQMQSHYQNKAMIRFSSKADLMVEELEKIKQQYGLLQLTQNPLIGAMLANNCVKVLNVNYGLNLKWIIHILINFSCKLVLMQLEESAMASYTSRFNFSTISISDNVKYFASDIAIPAIKIIEEAEKERVATDQIDKKLETFIYDTRAQYFKENKFQISMYPLLRIFLFGKLPIEIKAEDIWKGATLGIHLLDWYWRDYKDRALIQKLNSKYFIYGVRLLGLMIFMNRCCAQYQNHIQTYIRDNLPLFLTLLNEVQSTKSTNPEFYTDAEKKLKEFIKNGYKTSFENWKSSKNAQSILVFAVLETIIYAGLIATAMYAVRGN